MSLSSAKSQSMITINEYISKNETAKPESVAYLTNRCAALYTYISGLNVEKNKKLSDEYLLKGGYMEKDTQLCKVIYEKF